MRKHIVRTSNREIYDNISKLNSFSEVFIKNVSEKNIGRIVSNLNKREKVVESVRISNGYIIKKKNPVNIDVYWR